MAELGLRRMMQSDSERNSEQCRERTFEEHVDEYIGAARSVHQALSSSNSAFASFKSFVSKPSVNQLYTGASNS